MDLSKLIIGPAAGMVKTIDDVQRICRVPTITRITVGSITLEPRVGNIGQTAGYNPATGAYANSLGLPNAGIRAYRILLPTMRIHTNFARKELWASIAGFSPEEYTTMTHRCFFAGADGVELNFGCPNVWGEDGRKPIPSYDPRLMGQILAMLAGHFGLRGREMPIAVKISPTGDTRLLQEIARVITQSSIVSEVVVSNTIPDQDLLLEDGSHALRFTASSEDREVKHLGGLSGKPLLEGNMRAVALLRNVLPPEIRIIGCGGIFSGKDALRYLQAGAVGFECAAAYMVYGEGIFNTILAELVDLTEN